jgi:hypothetical protein
MATRYLDALDAGLTEQLVCSFEKPSGDSLLTERERVARRCEIVSQRMFGIVGLGALGQRGLDVLPRRAVFRDRLAGVVVGRSRSLTLQRLLTSSGHRRQPRHEPRQDYQRKDCSADVQCDRRSHGQSLWHDPDWLVQVE